MMQLNFDPQSILKSNVFSFILIYIFILEIVSSQNKESNLYKNIFVRLLTNVLALYILDFSIIQSIALSLVVTTIFFVTSEK